MVHVALNSHIGRSSFPEGNSYDFLGFSLFNEQGDLGAKLHTLVTIECRNINHTEDSPQWSRKNTCNKSKTLRVEVVNEMVTSLLSEGRPYIHLSIEKDFNIRRGIIPDATFPSLLSILRANDQFSLQQVDL